MLSSCCEKDLCASVALNKQGIRSDWKSDLLGSEPLTMCRDSNRNKKGTLLLYIPQVPKNGTHVCSPYPTRQVSKSWHTLDGVFPKNKRKAKSHVSCKMRWVPVTNRLYELINSGWPSQNTISVLIIIMTEFKIVLDFWTNTNETKQWFKSPCLWLSLVCK